MMKDVMSARSSVARAVEIAVIAVVSIETRQDNCHLAK